MGDKLKVLSVFGTQPEAPTRWRRRRRRWDTDGRRATWIGGMDGWQGKDKMAEQVLSPVDQPRRTSLRRLLRWLPAMTWMAFITWLSGQTSLGRSEEEFTVFTGWLIPKTAHLVEYGLLAFLIDWALEGQRSGLTLVLTCLFAVSDEWHQSFVPGREATLRDVLIDALGAVIGVWAYRRVVRLSSEAEKR